MDRCFASADRNSDPIDPQQSVLKRLQDKRSKILDLTASNGDQTPPRDIHRFERLCDHHGARK